MTEASLPEDQRPTLPPGRRAGTTWDGRYRLVRQLGRGGFGEVWLAIDTQRNDQRVALKIIFSHVVDEVPDFATRFTREILVLRALRHAGVPQIFNDGRTNAGEFFYTMEFVAGETLGSWIKKRHAATEATTVVAQVAEILRDCHQRGVVHRDLKPANIMLHADAGATRVFVLDFGIAKVVQRGKDLADIPSLDSKIVIGTAAYMAPEQLRGDNPTPAADVFALGIVLHEVLLGERPQHGATDYELAAARLGGDLRVAPRAGLAEPTRRLLESMLRLDPAQRPAMADVAGRLRPGGKPAQIEKATRRWPRAALLAVCVVAVLAVGWRIFANVGNEPEKERDDTRPQPAPVAATTITIEVPAAGSTVGKRFRIKGRVRGGEPGPLVLAGTSLDIGVSGEFDNEVDWRGGDGEVDILADVAREAPHKVWFDVTPPTVEIVAPRPGLCTASNAVPIEVRATDTRSKVVKVTAAETTLQPDEDGVFRGTLSLTEGRTAIQVIATDAVDNISPPAAVEVICDQTLPALDLDVPKVIRSLTGKVSGTCVDQNLAQLEINSTKADVDAKSGAFELRTTFAPDRERMITVSAVATDKAGLTTRKGFSASYDPLHFVITAPNDGATVPSGQADIEVRGQGNAKFAAVTVSQEAATLDGLAFSKTVRLEVGRNAIVVAGTDIENDTYEPVTLTVTREAAPTLPVGCEAIGTDKDATGRAKTIRHVASQEQLVLVAHGTKPFYIGKFEVTAEHYAPFCAKTGRAKLSLDKERLPITGIKIDDAAEFCAFLGLRLPTAEEWALAAGGPPPGRDYPWDGPFDAERCNYGNPQRSPTQPLPVGDCKGDVTPEGAYDMAGNVQEYVASPDKAKPATVCGGAYCLTQAACKATAKDSLGRTKTPSYVGFRVALDAQ